MQAQARDSDRIRPPATNRGEPLTAGGQRSWAAVEALQMVKAGDRVDIMWTVALLVSFAEVKK